MYCFCIRVEESFICYILTSGVNINLCINYKIFCTSKKYFYWEITFENWHSIVCGILCRLRLGSLDEVIQFIIVQLRKSCFFSRLLSFWFEIFIKAQIEIWEIFVHFLISVSKVKEIDNRECIPESIQIRRETQKSLRHTTMFTYSHANTALGQSERAYYLSYFIKINLTLTSMKWLLYFFLNFDIFL